MAELVTAELVTAEAATPPTDHAIYVALLFYRFDSRGNREIFVRYNPDEEPITEYSIPIGNSEGTEDLEACAKVCASTFLELDPARMEFKHLSHADVTNVGRKFWVRIFLLEANSEVEAVAQQKYFHGWKYAFILLSSLETVSIYDNINVARGAIEYFFKSTVPSATEPTNTTAKREPWYRKSILRRLSIHKK
ncbi:hypothetical protein F5Y18DRAFT_433992 [Xylariaceae sp. FL1019]|nr:hypothetical protein F5Y18DRAFT_433992 [Xylariaceae sp. FL1019]